MDKELDNKIFQDLYWVNLPPEGGVLTLCRILALGI